MSCLISNSPENMIHKGERQDRRRNESVSPKPVFRPTGRLPDRRFPPPQTGPYSLYCMKFPFFSNPKSV